MKHSGFDQSPYIAIWETNKWRYPLELSTRASLQLIDQVSECGNPLFVLTGGDPTRACDLACLHCRAKANEGRGFLFVSHTGEIYPSGFLPISAGNIREDSLIDVYRNSELFKNLRDTSQLKGKCGDCEFKEVCSGSRARAYAMTGDYFAEEPLCSYIPGKTLPARSARELEVLEGTRIAC